jgi:general secretion pathway protein M
MSAQAPTDPPTGLAALRDSSHRAWRGLALRWTALPLRDRKLLALGAAVLGAFLVWRLAIAPAWHSLRSTPVQLETLERQLQQMQAQAVEASALRAVAPVPVDQAQAALTAATERLGAPGKLSLQGERAVLSLKGASHAQISAWLAEARAGARARMVEATLTQSGPGLYDGSLTLALRSGQ